MTQASQITSIFNANIFKLLAIFLVFYIGGLLVKYKNIRVNYTRKINHFFVFFFPSFVDKFFVQADLLTILLSEAVFIVCATMIFIKPLRQRIFFIRTAFSSFDRPEDRPYTLLWFITDTIAGYLVVMPTIQIYDKYNIMNLLPIPILISGISDGLAEPVGVRLGRHKYLVYALFTKRKYVRSLEGSLIFFISSILVVAFFFSFFTQPQYITAVITIPVILTLVEALSPHTMDNTLISLFGFIAVFLIKQYI